MPVDEAGDALPTSMSVKSNGSGNVVWFDEITYSAPGTYTYKIVETNTDEPIPGVTNDTTEQTVTVTVTDDKEGGLNVSVSSTEASPATFTNAYNETTISIPVVKELSIPEGLQGSDSIKGKFKFTLRSRRHTDARSYRKSKRCR